MWFMTSDSLRLIARRIRFLRQQKGWSQAHLSKKSGVSQKTISNIENEGGGRESTTLDKVEKLAQAFGLELWQLCVSLDDTDELLIPPLETKKLLKNYFLSSPKGRDSIERMAELESRYGEAHP